MSLVSTLVAMLTVVGVVAQSSPAAAGPREELMEHYGFIPDDPAEMEIVAQDDAYWQHLTLCAMHGCDPASGVVIPPGGALTGTATAVRSGLAQVTRGACSTGWACLSLAGAALVGLGTHVYAADWLAEQGSGDDLSGAPVNYYPSVRAKSWVLNNTVTSALSINSADSITWSGQGIANVSGWTGTFSVRYWVASDWVNKATGQWVHQPSTLVGATWQTGQSKSVTFDPTSGASAADVELRRVHVVEDGTVGVGAAEANLARGWHWGQELVGATDTFKSVTRCQRPDGTTYDVESVAIGQEAGGVNVAACQAGDVPLYNEVWKCTAAGACSLQSVVNLRRTAPPADWAPDCAAAGCRWVVKVGGVPCTVGSPLCVSWTTNKDQAQCFYGPYLMPLENCYWLERAYQQKTPGQPIPATAPNTDGDPATFDGPEPNWNPTPSPSATPTSQPTSTASPSSGTGGTPGPTGSASPSPSGSSSPSPSSSASPSPSASSSPSPSSSTPTGEPPVIPACVTEYNLGPVQTEVVALANYIGPNYGVETMYGYRDPGSDWAGEHSSGLAVDFMVGTDGGAHTKGQAIADYLQAEAKRWGVHWIIWEQHVWNVERADEGWRLMEDRGSPTENHFDHVHVYLYDLDPNGVVCSTDGGEGGAGGGCLSKAVSWNPVDWVYWPTRCVLTWAFVPSGVAVQAELDGLREAWAEHPPGSLVEAARPVLSGVTDGWSGECVMPDFSPVQDVEARLPCEPPGGSAWSAIYLVLQFAMVGSCAVYVWSKVASGVGAQYGAGDAS